MRWFLFVAAVLAGLTAVSSVISARDKESKWNLPPSQTNRNMSVPERERLEKIPTTAAISAHRDGYLHVLDEDGTNVRQISFETPQGAWEHVAVSPDRRFIAANEQMPNPASKPGGVSRLWLFDTVQGTRTRLVPAFDTAGNGGVDWDRNGFIYFAAKEKDIVAQPQTPADFRANAGENDIYRIKYDGTGLQRLTHSKSYGEADVSVSEDGAMIAYANLNILEEVMEIWAAAADGSGARMVFKGGKPRISSVHDPELSPDNKFIVFSRVNHGVPPNFPNNPDANTAHDIYRLNLSSGEMLRLTRPGHISIVPDWVGDKVLFLDISERERYAGLATVAPDKPDQAPHVIVTNMNIGKWIPR